MSWKDDKPFLRKDSCMHCTNVDKSTKTVDPIKKIIRVKCNKTKCVGGENRACYCESFNSNRRISAKAFQHEGHIGYGDSLWPVRNRTTMELYTEKQWQERFGLYLKEDARGLLMHSSFQASIFNSRLYEYFPIEETVYKGKVKTPNIEEYYQCVEIQKKGDTEFIKWRYSKLVNEHTKEMVCRRYPEILENIDPVRIYFLQIQDIIHDYNPWTKHKTSVKEYEFRDRSLGEIDTIVVLAPNGESIPIDRILYEDNQCYVDYIELEKFSVNALKLIADTLKRCEEIHNKTMDEITKSLSLERK